MPRNTKKYAYLELAIVRESPLWQALQEDAVASGKSVAQVATQRLADYYRPASQQTTAQTPPLKQSAQPALPLPAPFVSVQEIPARIASASEASSIATGESETPEPTYQAERAKANALAALEALDAWEPG